MKVVVVVEVVVVVVVVYKALGHSPITSLPPPFPDSYN